MNLSSATLPHRRYNPLRRQWVLVSPQRTARPWQGQTTKPVAPERIAYDPTCYLCPGNPRAGGFTTPPYAGVYAFDNDYPALLAESDPIPPPVPGSLLIAEPETGRCRVICFDPDHSLTLSQMPVESIERVIECWKDETATLGDDPNISYVQVFENRGAMMGSSNPHPHCQVWATSHIPDEPATEAAAQLDYFTIHQRPMLTDYLHQERGHERIVCQNDTFAVIVPYWAVWPFETIVIPKQFAGSFTDLTPAQVTGLAEILKRITTIYDALFSVSFPYTMGFHQRPTDGDPHPEWLFHAHFFPPLLRSAEIRKFMVGFEMLGMPQRDITPEKAAEMLRAAADTLTTVSS